MATVDEIKDKLPIVLKSRSSGLLIRVDSISPCNKGVGIVVGSGNNNSLTTHRVGDHSATWHIANFNVFEG